MKNIAKKMIALLFLTLALAHPAHAGSLYAFGDSLTDDGTAYRSLGGPPSTYDNGRWSNGPVWVEYIPAVTGLNFTATNDSGAGGAFTGHVVYDGVDYGNNIVGQLIPVAPGINNELASFIATGQRFGKGDVVGLWGGANNYIQFSDIVQANPANAATIISQGVSYTVTQMSQDASTLIGLGARTLLVPNMYVLGYAPAYNTMASTYAAMAAGNNAALPVAMQKVHRQTGANIIVLNTYQLLTTMIANPARYGLANVTDSCIAVASCLNGSKATQNSHFFWDGVHPTTHVHSLIGAYAGESLVEFESLTVPAQLGATGGADFTTLLNNRLEALRSGAGGFSYNIDGASGSNGDPDQKFGLFVGGGGGNGYRNNDGGTDLGFTYTNAATILGVDYRFSQTITAGLALGYNDDHANVNEGGKVQNEAFDVGAYALVSSGPIYVHASVGFGDNWYRTSRNGVGYGAVIGKPYGHNYIADIEGGYNVSPWHGIGITPQVGLSYNDAALQGYTESGDPLLTQQVSSQGYQEILATTGFTASTGLELKGLWLAPFASAAAQIHLSNEGDDFTSSFTDEPVVSLTNRYPSQPPAWALLGAGINASLSSRLTASIDVSTTAFRNNGNAFLASGGASWRF